MFRLLYIENKINPGTVLTSAISNLDLLPTIARWTNSPLPKNRELDGQDISQLLENKVKESEYIHGPIFIVNGSTKA